MMELTATRITAGYGAEPVLHEVSVTLGQGELVGLIGPNGCGKSTLLRCLSRTLRISSGTLQLDGRDIMAWPPREAARRLAFVPQQEAALFEFTVRDLVLMGRYPHLERWKGETERDYKIVMQALADADILHLADRPVTQLSGGEHRRVLLARALAQQTPLLLLDEPTAHLDVTHQVELLTLVRQQTRSQGQGALAALHDLNQAAEFCDRLILMRSGHIIAQGAPEAVLTAANLRTAYNAEGQIGSNPVTGRPMLLTVHALRQTTGEAGTRRVHVICGGGTGVGTLGTLVRCGYRVTAGVLNEMDSDQTAAEALGIETAVEAPFSPIGTAARKAAANLMAHAETVMITPVPFGNGNLANLELALEAQANGVDVVLLGAGDLHARDYAAGAAAVLFQRLIANGAVTHPTLEDWIAAHPASALAE
jgi:iron complex transport system ATP-binding protein